MSAGGSYNLLYDSEHHHDIMMCARSTNSAHYNNPDLRFNYTVYPPEVNSENSPLLLILLSAATASYLWYLDFYVDGTS